MLHGSAVRLFLYFHPGGRRANGRCATSFLTGHLGGTKEQHNAKEISEGMVQPLVQRLFLPEKDWGLNLTH